MDVFLMTIAVILALLGLLGSFLPAIPGPPLSYAALLLMQLSGQADYSTAFLIVWAAITLVVVLVDLFVPVWMTRRKGGSKTASRGAAIGLLVGLLVGPLGVILGPFVGAFIGQLIEDRGDTSRALDVAKSSFFGFLLGTGMKLIICGMMLFYVIRSVVTGG